MGGGFSLNPKDRRIAGRNEILPMLLWLGGLDNSFSLTAGLFVSQTQILQGNIHLRILQI
jgi:hypothetical protein